MTVFLPIQASSPFPQSPSFLIPSPDPTAHVIKVIKAIMRAKRIVIVCGAGISVQAGIPDFRSSEGLFQTLKRDNPREALNSGKDLFDASVFNSEHTTSLFCQMIAQLSELSKAAEPTPFHQVLRALNDRGKLLRVYTQNIDAIERKSGLSFGVPVFDDRRYKPRSKGRQPVREVTTPIPQPATPHASSSRLPSPPAETPRCIPLHGTLQTLHCQTCTHSFPLEDHLPSLSLGTPPRCPECTSMEATRQLVGKRARGVGKLRPSVVLYNETHKDGEGVGEMVRRDLIGSSRGKGRSGADLLLVVGTSLRVPGTKRIVREFAKAVHSRGAASKEATGLLTPTPSPRRSPSSDEEPSIRTAYLNLDFPVPTREWEGVFDVWLQGDAQKFAEMLQEELWKETRTKEAATERKKKREQESLLPNVWERKEAKPNTKRGRKRNFDLEESPSRAAKQRKISASLPSPPNSRSIVKTKKKVTSVPNSSLHGREHSTLSGIVLRIPARPKPPSRKLFVPEVYITTCAPGGKTISTQGYAQPTSTRAAVQTKKAATRTKAGRRAARAAYVKTKDRLQSRSRSHVAQEDHGVIAEDDVSNLTDVPEDLPDSFVRTVQYGLRGG